MRLLPIGLTAILLPALGACSTPGSGADAMTPQNLPATLSIERVFADPGLNGPAPANIKISPDSSRVAFLRGTAENQLRYDLWEFNRKTGNTGLLVSADSIASVDAELSDEEKARRERQRISALSGIVDYHFSPDGQALLFPLGGDLYLYNLVTGNTNALTQSAGAEIDPKFSPKGRYISFVRGHDLYMIEIETGKETRLTDTGSETVRNGLAEFIAQEEMDRDTAYWWAPDETAIAFLQTDESGVAIEKRYEVYAEKINIVEQRYPATGTANATYKLGILDVGSLATQFLDLGDEPDIYIARVDWYPDSLYLTAQRQSRDQRTLDLLRFDRHSGNARTLLTETSDIWIDLYDDLHFLPERKQFVWASARDGFKHFYLYDYEGNLQRQLTAGDWEVTGNRNKQALLSIDKVSGDIFFMATKATPTERHLYRSNLKVQKNRGPQRISDTAGWHNISFANDSSFYVDSFSNGDTPPQVRVHKANGDALGFIEENPLNDQHPYAPYLATHASMEFGTLKANDGQDLHYYIKRPKEASSEKRPAIVFVYGGPHGQRVKNQWGGLIEQAFVQRGYVVFSLDNRGTDFRGTDFDAPIYQRLGQDEVLDQQVGAKYLASLPDVDPKRIGIYGWSYGGYMTLMCMLKTPDTYAAGVAGAPVTDWHLYDTHYTERYLGHPEQNPEGYEAGSVFPFVKNLNAPLLLMHGMADDNVLFSHTTKLMQTLQSEGKLFELMTYPGSKHSLIRGPREGTHAFRSILDFFDRHLGQKN